MGTQFFWFYDILVAGILIGTLLKGLKKGFVSTLVGMVAVLVGFLCALFFSEAIAAMAYNGLVEKPLSEAVNAKVEETLGETGLYELTKIDSSKIMVGGKYVTELSLKPDNAGKINIDLSNVDMSQTGINSLDLADYGIDSAAFASEKINIGTITVLESELLEDDIGTIVLARILSSNTGVSNIYDSLLEVANQIKEQLPQAFTFINETAGGDTVVSKIFKCLLKANGSNFSDSILNTIIKPVVLVPIRAIAFALIFGIVTAVIMILANVLKLVNKIPLIGTLNSVLGGIIGIAEGAVVCLLVCIFVQIVISFTDNTLIFLNTMTIDKTYVFRYIYDFNFLNFLN